MSDALSQEIQAAEAHASGGHRMPGPDWACADRYPEGCPTVIAVATRQVMIMKILNDVQVEFREATMVLSKYQGQQESLQSEIQELKALLRETASVIHGGATHTTDNINARVVALELANANRTTDTASNRTFKHTLISAAVGAMVGAIASTSFMLIFQHTFAK